MDPLSGMGPMLQGPPTSMMGGGGGAFGGAGGVSSLAGSPFPVSLGATLGGSGTPGSPAKNFGSLPSAGPVSQAQGGFNPMQGLTSQLSGNWHCNGMCCVMIRYILRSLSSSYQKKAFLAQAQPRPKPSFGMTPQL